MPTTSYYPAQTITQTQTIATTFDASWTGTGQDWYIDTGTTGSYTLVAASGGPTNGIQITFALSKINGGTVSGHEADTIQLTMTLTVLPNTVPSTFPSTLNKALSVFSVHQQFTGTPRNRDGSFGSPTTVSVDNFSFQQVNLSHAGGDTTPTLGAKQPGAIAIDGPRQWLHVAKGMAKAVTTYHAGDGTSAFFSPNYSVDYFVAFRTDSRRGKLLMLGISGANALVFLSGDGGLTATQVLSVTTANSLLEVISEKGLVVLLVTDATSATAAGNVSCRQSLDGGTTWGTAAASTYGGSTLVASLSDLTYDPRRGALDLLCTTSSSTLVLESKDSGITWTLKLS